MHRAIVAEEKVTPDKGAAAFQALEGALFRVWEGSVNSHDSSESTRTGSLVSAAMFASAERPVAELALVLSLWGVGRLLPRGGGTGRGSGSHLDEQQGTAIAGLGRRKEGKKGVLTGTGFVEKSSAETRSFLEERTTEQKRRDGEEEEEGRRGEEQTGGRGQPQRKEIAIGASRRDSQRAKRSSRPIGGRSRRVKGKKNTRMLNDGEGRSGWTRPEGEREERASKK